MLSMHWVLGFQYDVNFLCTMYQAFKYFVYCALGFQYDINTKQNYRVGEWNYKVGEDLKNHLQFNVFRYYEGVFLIVHGVIARLVF